MKQFDLKSAAAGFLAGVLVIGTAFAAGSGIQSATFNATKVSLDGKVLPLQNPLVSIVKAGEKNASNYMPLRELLESMGYTVEWDGGANMVCLTSPDTVITPNQKDGFTLTGSGTIIAQSGSFHAEAGQTLTLTITSSIKGGSADFFLFDPNGKEQRITIGAENMTKTIPLSAGTWAYNCSGKFQDGSVKIVGTIA